MIYIQFNRRTLLFGESLFWLASLLVEPLCFLPDFDHLKEGQRLVIHYIPHWQWFLKQYRKYIFSSAHIRSVVPKIAAAFQIAYLLISAMFALVLQDDILKSMGINVRRTDRLSYKSLLYGPVLYRIGISIVTAVALHDQSYQVWDIHNKFDIFSVKESTQCKIAILALSITLVDTVCSQIDFLYISQTILPRKFKWADWSWEETNEGRAVWLNAAAIIIASGLCAMNIVIRYRPVCTTIYASTCMARHLSLINAQLAQSCQIQQTDFLRVRAHNQFQPNASHVDSANSCGHQERTDCLLDGLRRTDTMAAGGIRKRSFSANEYRWLVRSLKVLRRQLSDSMVENPPAAAPTLATQQDNSSRRQDPFVITISSIYELEKHLVQLKLFVEQIDIIAPSTVYSSFLINMVAIFFSIFYLIELDPTRQMELMYASLYIVGHTIPVVCLSVMGHLVKVERVKMSTLLELTYLRDPTHCLIYKQMTSSQFALAHVFKLVEGLRFTCDDLWDIDLRTLSSMLIYLATSVLIVIQFDIIVSSEQPEADAKN